MNKELLVSPSGCVEIQRTVDELINHIQQEENKAFYQECLRIQIDPEALLKCEKEILDLQERIKQLQKERDAAIKDLEHHCACGDCVHNYVTPFDDCNCELGVINCNWEWKGVHD